MHKPFQNQAEYDRAKGELAGNMEVAKFSAKVLELFPDANRSFTERNYPAGAEPQFVFVNSCAKHWTPGTPADFCVHIGIANLCSLNMSGSTIAIAVAKANDSFDDFVAEKVSGCIAAAFGGDPWGWRAPFRATRYEEA